MAENEERRNWAELPSDILSLIYKKLGAIIVLWSAQVVCRSWRGASLEPSLWRRIDLRCNLLPRLQATDRANIARQAVDRSGGDVEELFIGGRYSNALLSCIVGRTNKLRCLAVFPSTDITSKVLVEFIERCRLLEELQIIESYFFSEDYVNICRACPELKRFWLNDFSVVDSDNECYFEYDEYAQLYEYNSDNEFDPEYDAEAFAMANNMPNLYDEEAFAIANNMPSLRELNLIGNRMTNKGLDAILRKCLHLEFLDIRHCHHVNLSESMRAKLAVINTVKLSSSNMCIPHDDYEYSDSIIDGYCSDYSYSYRD